MHEYSPKKRRVGSVRLDSHKSASTAQPIAPLFIPKTLSIPVATSASTEIEVLVAPGDRVLAGQRIARTKSADFGADSHASSSGTVRSIAPVQLDTQRGNVAVLCVIVDTDGKHETITAPCDAAASSDLLQAIQEAGITGLGGAAFATALKLSRSGNCPTLIINGAECEPYISCDDMLMRSRPSQIIRGSQKIADIVGAAQCIIAIERDKPEAIAAIRSAITQSRDKRLLIAEIPTIYPAGGERQLIELLTGKEVPSEHYPADIGIICQNVATAAAVDTALFSGYPLTQRVVTVAGTAIESPMNIDVLIGTSISDLIAHCGGDLKKVRHAIVGGNMMGVSLTELTQPITKGSNCVIANKSAPVAKDQVWPCIRCGECAAACPARLQPQALHFAARSNDTDALSELGVMDCIECGCCDVVCPSQIPLTMQFREAMALLTEKRLLERFSLDSQARYESRTSRLERLDGEEQARQAALLKGLSVEPSKRQETIAAAVARARGKRPPGKP